MHENPGATEEEQELAQTDWMDEDEEEDEDEDEDEEQRSGYAPADDGDEPAQ